MKLKFRPYSRITFIFSWLKYEEILKTLESQVGWLLQKMALKDVSSSSDAMFNESVDLSLETVIWSACRKNIHVHKNQNLLWMLSQETSIEAEKQLSYYGSTLIKQITFSVLSNMNWIVYSVLHTS